MQKGAVPDCRIHERSRLGPGYNWHHTGLPHHLEMNHKNIFRELLKGYSSEKLKRKDSQEEKFPTLAIINMLFTLKELIFIRLPLDSFLTKFCFPGSF